jgi:hypothetical protein
VREMAMLACIRVFISLLSKTCSKIANIANFPTRVWVAMLVLLTGGRGA